MRDYLGHIWLEEPWRYLIRKRDDRRWLVLALKNYDYDLRDAAALGIVSASLSGRRDVDYLRVSVVRTESLQLLPTGVDLLFLGRARMFLGSRFGECARLLESRMAGRFIDPPTGEAGDSICYRDHRFSSHPMRDGAPDRRYDREYAVIVSRTETIGGEPRHLVMLAGLGSLGTALLAIVLGQKRLRLMLARQAGQVLELKGGRHRPQEWIEVLVRFEVRDAEQYGRILNFIDQLPSSPAGEMATPDFAFEVDAVAVSTGDGRSEVRLNKQAGAPMLELQSLGDRGRMRRPDNDQWSAVPRMRFNLLRQLATDPEHTDPETLCDVLARARLNGRSPKEPLKVLQKHICDLNGQIFTLIAQRPIKCKRSRYVCEGVRFVLTSPR